MKSSFFKTGVSLLFFISLALFLRRDSVRNLFSYGLDVQPSHSPADNCRWVKNSFKKAPLIAFTQDCRDGNLMTFEDAQSKVIGRWKSNPDYEFTIQVFSKETTQMPLDVVKKYYSQLTASQQKICEIQDADRPIDYFTDGRPMITEDPHPTAHKIRYRIHLTDAEVKKILNESGGVTSGPPHDYLCGYTVGSAFTSRPPYFEFDDRTPGKYLLVGSLGFDDPPIDLNSIRF